MMLAVPVSCNKALGVDRPSGKTILHIGDWGVTETEYGYFLTNHKENGAADDDSADEAALYDLRRECAVLTLAKQYGVELGDAARERVEQEIDSAASALGGDDKFEAGLAEFGMTRGLYRYLLQLKELESSLRAYLTDEASGIIVSDDKTVLNDIRENFIAAKQILISNDEGDDPEENRALAGEILSRLEAGEDFDELCAEYNEDANMDAEYGRYFTAGMFPSQFEDAARALEIGEHSGVVETSVGYHIILRVGLDDGYIDKNFENLRYYFLNRRFNEILEEKIASLEVVRED